MGFQKPDAARQQSKRMQGGKRTPAALKMDTVLANDKRSPVAKKLNSKLNGGGSLISPPGLASGGRNLGSKDRLGS